MLKGLGKWKVLNSKEVRVVVELVMRQWGADLSDIRNSCGFLESSDGDIFVISRDIEKLDLENLRIDSLGLYFGQVRNPNRERSIGPSRNSDLGAEIRLSIEGSQIVGKTTTKNIVEIDVEELRQWLAGNDLEKDYERCSGYVIIKHKSDFLGCGKCKDGKILNFVPKARRVVNL